MHKIYKTILIPLILLLSSLAGAQGWERAYGGSDSDELMDLLHVADDGFIAVGATQSFTPGDRNIWMIKTDADGNLDWTQSIGNLNAAEIGNSIRTTTDGGYIIGGTVFDEEHRYGHLVKTDYLGNPEWSYVSVIDSVEGRMAIQTLDGGYALVGYKLNPPTGPDDMQDKDVLLIKLNPDGTEAWWKNYGGEEFDEGYALVENPDATLALIGTTKSYGTGNGDMYWIKVDADGNYINQKTYGPPSGGRLIGFDIILNANNNYVIASGCQDGGGQAKRAIIWELNPSGNWVNFDEFYDLGLQTAYSIKNTSDGGYAFTGEFRTSDAADRQVYLTKIDNNFNEDWTKTFGGTLGDEGNSIVATPAGFALAGYTRSFGSGHKDAYLIRTDNSGISLSNFIIGYVYADLNGNCNLDASGQGVPNQIIEIFGPQTYYGTTDDQGFFSIPVDEGSYTSTLAALSPYWTACADSLSFSLSGVFDTAVVSFFLKPIEETCPMLITDVSTLNLRRCFPATYNIHYENRGAAVAEDATVEVTFDSYLHVDSSSIPWVNQVGDTYTFDIGNVNIFDEGEFDVYVTVDCDSTVLGQTHCVEAHVLPDSLCLPIDPNWDGASIELSAKCIDSENQITISNIGDGNMDDPLGFVIIEDHIIGFTGSFDLEPMEDTTIIIISDGTTIRVEADQSPGHPGNSKPSVAIEGCGGEPFSTGYVIQFPQNDANPFIDIDCRENTGSFDPNDKQAFPIGYGEQHFLEANTDIEYLIRFQNTGTDTAFTVTIRDTLSSFLDVTSIQPGTASHSYRYELYSNGIVKFIFDDIMLPDSNVNEVASHGFVKFKISQRSDNPIGTIITNSAAIYFDYNAPIITNTTKHRIGENFILFTKTPVTPSPNAPLADIKVYPNPFVDFATFELKGLKAKEFQFSVFDLNGKLVQKEIYQSPTFQFHKGNLPKGMYVFQIEIEGQLASSGKIVLQ